MLWEYNHGAIAVIGDVMLDCFVTGGTKRLSPEAPVPVFDVGNERYVPGGAANVAMNIAALDGQVRLVGVIGADHYGASLRALIDAAAPQIGAALIVNEDGLTTVKTRIIVGQHHIVRIDREKECRLTEALESGLIDAARAAIETAAVVVISDYAKGTLTQRLIQAIIAHANALDIPVIVDPKGGDFSVYRGATILTPNVGELRAATGLPCDSDEDAERAASAASAATGAQILLTRSEKGMLLVGKDAAPFHLPTEAREVFDVSGAGDTVVATLAVCLASNMPVERAMRFANSAAGLVVAKVGTATVTTAELRAEMLQAEARNSAKPFSKIMTLEEAKNHRSLWQAGALSVGFTNGCFDLLHPGHISLIAQAKASCDRLIVALNSDDSVRRLKGADRPVQGIEARAIIMAALGDVDAVIVFDEDTPEAAIVELRPDVLIKGADYTEDQVVGASFVRSLGGTVVLADITPSQSTSALIARSRTPAS